MLSARALTRAGWLRAVGLPGTSSLSGRRTFFWGKGGGDKPPGAPGAPGDKGGGDDGKKGAGDKPEKAADAEAQVST